MVYCDAVLYTQEVEEGQGGKSRYIPGLIDSEWKRWRTWSKVGIH